ncbi:hypothetical protein Hte_007073 [Hypoxylon texense]
MFTEHGISHVRRHDKEAKTEPYRLPRPTRVDSDMAVANVTIKVHPSPPPSEPPPPPPPPSPPSPPSPPRRSPTGRKRDEGKLDPSSIRDRRQPPRKRKRRASSGSRPPTTAADGRDVAADADADADADSRIMNVRLREYYGHGFWDDTQELLPDLYELRRAWARLEGVVGAGLTRATLRQKEKELKRYFEDRWGAICEQGAMDIWGMSEEEINDVVGIRGKVEAFIRELCEVMLPSPAL